VTIAELIQTLRTYPSDAVVYVFDRGDDNAYPLIEVTPSEHAPNEEVYLDFN
jgi:hypothetical protein